MISCAYKILSRSNDILSRRNKLKNKILSVFRVQTIYMMCKHKFDKRTVTRNQGPLHNACGLDKDKQFIVTKIKVSA